MPTLQLRFYVLASKLKVQLRGRWSFYQDLFQLEVRTESFDINQITICVGGWVSFQSSCYRLSTTAAAWSEAEERCREQGAHLVVLNNVEELVRFKVTPVWLQMNTELR